MISARASVELSCRLQPVKRATIRLDENVLQVLRDFMARSREPLESTLRRVIREELRRTG
jgi:hypothetical protein